MSNLYVLDGHEPRRVEDIYEWGRYFQSADRRVARTEVAEGVSVSTVFLGVDHNWSTGPPILFETMVFGGPLNEWQNRYCTWDEAVTGHEAMVKEVIVAIENARVDWSRLVE